MRHIDEIVIHCTATPPDWMEGKGLAAQVDEIRRWHVEHEGYRDIGYHWLIGRDGSILPGRDESLPGAHLYGHNASSLGVCLIGGMLAKKTDKFEDHFTEAQGVALLRLLDDLRARYPAIERISGHNEYAAKGCPGFYVPAFVAAAKAKPQPTPQPSGISRLFAAILRLFKGD